MRTRRDLRRALGLRAAGGLRAAVRRIHRMEKDCRICSSLCSLSYPKIRLTVRIGLPLYPMVFTVIPFFSSIA